MGRARRTAEQIRCARFVRDRPEAPGGVLAVDVTPRLSQTRAPWGEARRREDRMHRRVGWLALRAIAPLGPALVAGCGSGDDASSALVVDAAADVRGDSVAQDSGQDSAVDQTAGQGSEAGSDGSEAGSDGSDDG